MLNDIRMHLAGDETEQQCIEEQSAAHIKQNYHTSMQAFAQHVPNMHAQLSAITQSSFSLFVNQHAQFNIVNYASGSTLYGLKPPSEIEHQLKHKQRCLYHIDCTQAAINHTQDENTNDIVSRTLQCQQYVQKVIDENQTDVLVLLGLGLGSHVRPLMQDLKPKHLIIYETDIGILRASLMSNAWADILNVAKDMNVQLYFQIGPNTNKIFQDLSELKQHFDCNNVLVYKHFDTVLHNAIADLIQTSTWHQLAQMPLVTPRSPSIVSDVPVWQANFELAKWKCVDTQHALFEANLKALEKTYPDLYQRFKHYQPSDWQVIESENAEVNMFNIKNQVPFYGQDSQSESCAVFNNFNQNPSQDGLVIGYRGEKSRHFIHNSFLIKTEKIMNRFERKPAEHPDQSKALIMFGLGAGYGFESMVKQKKIEQLFVLEPNADFFYASLFSIDWQAVFDKMEEDDSYLYLNIGDDGSHFSSDLMAHFYRIGPYVLNETYLFKAYDNQALNPIIDKLREQLKLMLAMSENFDHSIAGLQHSIASINRHSSFLAANAAQLMPAQCYETPVFIVGNGPSLDNSILAIKEYQGEAIIVSCGTALQALHRHNIVPDFHAEIEQYRSTFDWANLIDDLAYLKQITLISCNGIHPDTCQLYKDVKIVFKHGEASTRAIFDVIGGQAFKTLETAYPTVSNFSLSMFLAAGFKNLYLIGIDLGSVDHRHHHSKSSAYFDTKGTETYDYQSAQTFGIVTAGNFRAVVSTKTEFDIARMSMENALSLYAGFECYNTSDGAFIKGASPLNVDAILILSDAQSKQDTLSAFDDCFVTIDAEKFNVAFAKRYDHALLSESIVGLVSLSHVTFENTQQVRAFVDELREYLLTHYHLEKDQTSSLFFFYFHALSNSLNALLTKVVLHGEDETALDAANEIMQIWLAVIGDCQQLSTRQTALFDVSSSFTWKRENILLKRDFGDDSPSSKQFNLISYGVPSTLDIHDSNLYLDGLNITCHQTLMPGANNIIFVETPDGLKEALRQVSKHLKASMSCPRPLIVMHGDYHIWRDAMPLVNQCQIASFFICPKDILQTDSQGLNAGHLPLFHKRTLVNESLKRSLDTDIYKLFVFKPNFCKDGLKAAYADRKDEYSTQACSFIDTELMPLLQTEHFISFKTYVAECIESPLARSSAGTFEDSLHTRGQLFSRQYCAHNLLGFWYPDNTKEALY